MPLCKSALNFCQTNGAMCPPPHAFVAESRGLTEERAEPVHWRRNQKRQTVRVCIDPISSLRSISLVSG